MRAITLWQPWASLVAIGHKRIETRSWSTRYRGPILIHAAKRYPPVHSVPGFGIYNQTDGVRMLRSSDGRWFDLPLGAVVAVADLDACAPMVDADKTLPTRPLPRIELGWGATFIDSEGVHHPVEDRELGHFEEGRFGWVLDGAEELTEPVSAVGRQGLWTPSAELVEAVNDRIAA